MIVKSNTQNGSKLSEQLTNEVKTNEALGRVISLLNDWLAEQKDISADSQIAHQEICGRVDGLIKTLDKYYSKEEKEVEKDTSVADAIKALKFPQPQKIDFEPFSRLAESIEKQNIAIAGLASKFQQVEKQENRSFEPFMKELAAVISNNSNALSLLKPPIPKDDTELLSTIKEAIGSNKVKEWEFTVQYNPNDSISKVTAKPKM